MHRNARQHRCGFVGGVWTAYASVLGPGGETVLVEGEAGLEVLDAVLVLEEEDGAVAGGEAAVDLALGRGELVGGDDTLEHVQGDLPELLVLVTQEEDSLKLDGQREDERRARMELDVRDCSGC